VGLIHLNLLYNFPFDIKMRTKKLHISFKTVSGSVFLSSALVRHPLLIRFQLLPASNRSSTVALQQLHLRQLQLHSLSQHTAADGDAPVMPAIPLFLWWATAAGNCHPTTQLHGSQTVRSSNSIIYTVNLLHRQKKNTYRLAYIVPYT
jgi:hypothetical protein